MREELPPEMAARNHRSQRVAFLGLTVAGVVIGVPSVLAIAFLHQVFFWGALFGAALLVFGVYKLARLSRRSHPPRMTVVVEPEGLNAVWAGDPSKPISWSDITRVMDQPGGVAIIARGGRTVFIPRTLTRYDAMRQAVDDYRRSAPPPEVQTRVTLDEPGPEPVPAGNEAALALVQRVRGPLVWTAIASLLLVPIGLLTNPLLAGLGAGLATTFAGLWGTLVCGLKTWALGAISVSSFLVVQTTYRGRWARGIGALYAVIGLCLACTGALVTVACGVGLLAG